MIQTLGMAVNRPNPTNLHRPAKPLMARVGIVTPAFLRHYRRHIYVGLAFLAMFMTPADPWTMLAALIPLIGLFEASIFIAAAMALIRARDEEEPDESAA